MIKNTLLYIVSNAISRGAFVLYSPILLSLLTLEDFGLYNLVFILSMLISPILVFGGGSSILREGVVDSAKAYYLFIRYMFLSILISIILFTIVNIFDTSQYNWLTYAVMLSSVEASLLLVLAYYRTINKGNIYLYISIIKFILIIIIFFISSNLNYALNDILQLQFIMLCILSIVSLFIVMLRNNTKYISSGDNYSIFIFGLFLIPHGLSQWIMSSSDRILIKYFLTNEALGVYSIGYVVASLLLLINSGIGLALPQEMIKNYQKWKDDRIDIYWIRIYSISTIVLLLCIEIFFILDKNYFNLLKYYSTEMYLIFSFAYIGITILGFYYFYANYLFYFKKSKLISIQTFIAAVANIILTIVFLNYIGVVGAAVATMLSYLIYLYLVRKEALKLEIELKEISVAIDKIFYIIISINTIILGVFFYRMVK
jgi:O-antigen/teichoic acid export membrane protein